MDKSLLFVHAGIDPARPLARQSDGFWWATGGFARLESCYEGFGCVVRGFDPAHRGIVRTGVSLSLDGGCGFGGPLLALCLRADGEIVEQLSS